MVFGKRKERLQRKARIKETLEKQLQLLSEYSLKCDVYRELDNVTRAMIEVAGFLYSIR